MISFTKALKNWTSISLVGWEFLSGGSQGGGSSESLFPVSFLEDSGLGEELGEFHDFFLGGWLSGIAASVGVIMGSCFWMKETSKVFVSHFLLEVSWIFLPMFVLLGIGIPSLDLLYKMEEAYEGNKMTMKSCGYQWFWSYEGTQWNSTVDSYMADPAADTGLTYLSSEDIISLPSPSNISNIVTSGDVMHSWTLSSIYNKTDAIPGRMNTMNFEIFSSDSPLKLYGQCSELCGVNHSFMPIVVEILPLSKKSF